jgi:hypothetical protein
MKIKSKSRNLLLNPLRGSGFYTSVYHGFTPAVIHIKSFQDLLLKTANVV